VVRLISTGSRTGDAAYVVQKALAFGIVLLALAPAAHLAWVARDMPHFGHLHDDSIYFVCAKSIAEGHGYRILSLPAEPFQTKYPPLWPLILAGIWKLDPRFPENLHWGMALAWPMLPLFLALAWRWFRRAGSSGGTSVALCCMLALSPWIVFLSTTLESELLFCAVLLAALLAAGRASRNTWLALAAGILAAAAYLIKTAALPLVVAAPLWLALRRRYRAALVFLCAMLPGIAWWTFWVWGHLSPARDIVTLYYTNYLGYRTSVMDWHDLPLLIWKNLDAMCSAIAGLLIFDLGNTPWGMHLSRLLAIACVAGTVRLARRRGITPYHWFAAAYLAVLLIWHFPPTERLLLPVFPLLLAGLAAELANLTSVIRKSWARKMSDRAVAAGMAVALGALACLAVARNADAIFRQLPGIVGQHRTVLASNRAAFAWIALHLPEGAFYAYDDPVFFLYTGRHAASMPDASMPFYRQDRSATLQPFRHMPAFAREQHLDYLLFTAADFYRAPEQVRAEAQRILAREPAFESVYRSPLSSVYRLAPRLR
jgi:hypothetical protein